jgi:ABC-2 type transport system permease protein
MNGLRSLTLMEARLFWRDKAQVFFVFVLPLLIVVGFGSVPAIREGSDDFGGEAALDALIAPLGIALLLAVIAYTIIPQHVVAYREKGVLRRLSASPVQPKTLLAAVLAIKAVAAVIGAVLVVVVGGLALDLSMPKHPLGAVAAFTLGTVALLSVGLLIAANAPTLGAATGIGMLTFFPSMFLGGIYVPSEQLPEPVQRIGELTPLGATLQALRDSWVGTGARPLHLIVLVVAAVVFGGLAAKTFRWE